MRDNHHHGYPEIVNAYEREGQYFGALRIIVADMTFTVEFGVSEAGYYALKRILNGKPLIRCQGFRTDIFSLDPSVGH